MAQDFNFKDREEGNGWFAALKKCCKITKLFFWIWKPTNQLLTNIDKGNFQKALQACELALEQYPYSIELMLTKPNCWPTRSSMSRHQ